MKWNKNTAKKRPSMWYQDGNEKALNRFIYGPRVRIVYPNGVVEWASLDKNIRDTDYLFNTKACYIAWLKAILPKNQAEAIKIMNRFDKQSCFPEAEFLGWL